MTIEVDAPVEPFSVWEYVADELAHRKWSLDGLAIRMGGDAKVNYCSLELLEAQAACDPHHIAATVRLGNSMAEGLSRAFGTSKELWINLDEAYHRAILRIREGLSGGR